MRTKEELNSPEFNDDLSELHEALEKAGIEHVYKKHEAVELEPMTKELIGYWPSGEWHIFVGNTSIIRGMASFGLYELYGEEMPDPERFETVQEVLDFLSKKQ